ncbi:hypothetical protein AFK68_25090 [Hydrocoleum sp. CS-953]|uniref:hypothetical protein n=1 Tax=Hydrocoleum sp. CS-953 TaxID=1671698 RepID=UPI000B9AD7E0|nr:hypothetical protein [Hydrocoleum sp. CS-953]OZH52327.1 hypothetical protein AFK68_25090 [Hydrocoleum sp. CS-953]
MLTEESRSALVSAKSGVCQTITLIILVVGQESVGSLGSVGRLPKVGGIIVPLSFCACLPAILTF